MPVVLALGTALVTVLVWCEGDGSSFFGLFYLWVAVEAFYLLSRAGAALQVGLVAVRATQACWPPFRTTARCSTG